MRCCEIVKGLRILLTLAVIFLMASTNARSQEGLVQVPQDDSLHFSVDRPGISDYPTIVPKGVLQLESGMEYYQREDHRSIFLPTLMLRTAITKGVEVRMTNRLLLVDSTANSSEREHYYYGSIDLKAKLLRERGARPATSLLVGYGITPENNRIVNGALWGNYVLVLMENTLSDKFLLNYNVGVFWDGHGSSLSEMYSLCLEMELGHPASVFIEQSTLFNPNHKNDYWVDAGYTHLLARHSQVDISVGTNLNGDADDYFVAIGYSTRIPFKKDR
jgi:hypothetical protein